jgi:hypothetical protein
VFRQASHEVLGALEDEVPAQMAKHDQGRHVDFLSPRGVLVDLDSRPEPDASMLWKTPTDQVPDQ